MSVSDAQTTVIILALNRAIDNLEQCQGANYSLEMVANNESSESINLRISIFTLSKEVEANESLMNGSVFYKLTVHLGLIESLQLAYGLVSKLNSSSPKGKGYVLEFLGSYRNCKEKKVKTAVQ